MEGMKWFPAFKLLVRETLRSNFRARIGKPSPMLFPIGWRNIVKVMAFSIASTRSTSTASWNYFNSMRTLSWRSATLRPCAIVSRPGNPTDNALIESFNGRLRAECLNENWFLSLEDAEEKIEAWKTDSNERRPQSALGNLAPQQFASTCQARRGKLKLQIFNRPLDQELVAGHLGHEVALSLRWTEYNRRHERRYENPVPD
jgi:hypothetical protein